MITGKRVPFIDERSNMKSALKILSEKNLGVLIIRNKKKEQLVLLQMEILKEQFKKIMI